MFTDIVCSAHATLQTNYKMFKRKKQKERRAHPFLVPLASVAACLMDPQIMAGDVLTL